MALIEWTNALSVGVQEFDEQHQKLIAMINELHEAMQAGQDQNLIGKVLMNLINYTAGHFTNEEKLMTAHAYPELAAHRVEHQKLVTQVQALARDLRGGKAVLTMEVMNFLKDWLNTHILGTDRKYGPYLNTKGIR